MTPELKPSVRDGEQGGPERSHPGPPKGPPGSQGRAIVHFHDLIVGPMANDVEKGHLFLLKDDVEGI
eukprot:4680760-Pyramimonas_sp.AAC.1